MNVAVVKHIRYNFALKHGTVPKLQLIKHNTALEISQRCAI